MRPQIHSRARRLARVVTATALLSSCTLDIVTPAEPPPDTWDPALNTHVNGPVFQELLDRHVARGLPGAVLLVRTSEGQWNGAGGFADIERGEPMVPTHRHHAASVTKMYTAAAIMILAEEGLISLDAPIRDYLPRSVYGPVPNGSRSTVRQLLGHTSGIPDFDGDLAYDLDFLNDPLGSYSPSRLLSYLHGQSSLFAPGEGYFYSNAGYLLLAMIMDEVTGAGHADVISERILQPLGLSATYYKNEPGFPTPPGLVNSYHDLGGDGRLMNVSDLSIHNAEVFLGNAGLIGTSADFADFLEGLLDGLLVGPEYLSEMQEVTECSCYGLGLSYLETPFGPAIGHDGGDMGVLSEVRRFPDRGATIVLLANAGNSGAPEREFRRLWDEALEIALGDL